MGQINVAICSRDSEENYKWLKDFLEKRMCKRTNIVVHTVHITNNISTFQKEVSGNDFAILYHTKKHGRINITNVPGSLYDAELKFLHDHFRDNNVVVVIDDLEKSDDNEKKRIKEAQPDLSEYARELFLFTKQDKNYTANHWNKIVDGKVKKNLEYLKTCIKNAKRTKKSRFCTAKRTSRSTGNCLDLFMMLHAIFHNQNRNCIRNHQTILFTTLQMHRSTQSLHDV